MASSLYRASAYVTEFYQSLHSGLELLLNPNERLLEPVYLDNLYFAKRSNGLDIKIPKLQPQERQSPYKNPPIPPNGKGGGGRGKCPHIGTRTGKKLK